MRMATATMPSPPRAVTMTGSRRPGATISTTRTAAATRTAMTTGEIVPMSDQFIVSPPEPVDTRSSADRDAGGRQEGLGGRTEEIEDKTREEPEHDDQETERKQGDRLGPGHVGQVAPQTLEEVRHRAEGDPLEHPQEVSSRQDHGDDRGDRDEGRNPERADEDQELADEAGQPGQPGRGQDEEAEDGGPDRHRRRQAAHLGDRSVVGSLVDHADEKEEPACDQAVADHLPDRALEGSGAEDEDAESHEDHVADGAVGDQALQVGL